MDMVAWEIQRSALAVNVTKSVQVAYYKFDVIRSTVLFKLVVQVPSGAATVVTQVIGRRQMDDPEL